MEYVDGVKQAFVKGLRNSPRELLSSALNVSGYGNSPFASNNIKEIRNSATRNLASAFRRSPSPTFSNYKPQPRLHRPLPIHFNPNLVKKQQNLARYANTNRRKRNMRQNNRQYTRHRNYVNVGNFRPIQMLE
jgi:hypothetical protein